MAMTKTTQTAKKKLSDTAEAVKDRAKEATETAKETVVAKAHEAKTRAEDSANSRISTFADTVDEKANRLDRVADEMADGYPHTQATRQAAELAHQAADRLRETDVQRLVRDVEQAARKHPIIASVAAVAAGAAVGRFLKSRSDEERIGRVAHYTDPQLPADVDRFT